MTKAKAGMRTARMSVLSSASLLEDSCLRHSQHLKSLACTSLHLEAAARHSSLQAGSHLRSFALMAMAGAAVTNQPGRSPPRQAPHPSEAQGLCLMTSAPLFLLSGITSLSPAARLSGSTTGTAAAVAAAALMMVHPPALTLVTHTLQRQVSQTMCNPQAAHCPLYPGRTSLSPAVRH